MDMLNSLNVLAGKISPQNHDDANNSPNSPTSRYSEYANFVGFNSFKKIQILF